ncbi:MAG: hypothetical protein JNM79_04770 [Burkholderiales bacterium]|nr:hypothetical protein [Burkholderiales bacterium]
MKTAALLLLTLTCLPALAQTEPLAHEPRAGRLFFTPDERARLDAVRGKSAATEVVEAPNMLTVNGYIARAGQKPRPFIDGRAVPAEGLSGLTIAAQAGGRLRITQPGGQSISAKAGQRVDLSAGTATEAYDLPGARADKTAPGLPAQFLAAKLPQADSAPKAKAPRQARRGQGRRAKGAAAGPMSPPPAQVAPPATPPMGAAAPAIPLPLATPTPR